MGLSIGAAKSLHWCSWRHGGDSDADYPDAKAPGLEAGGPPTHADDGHNVVNQHVSQPCGDNVVQSVKDNVVHGGNGDDDIQEWPPCEPRYVLVANPYVVAHEKPKCSWLSKLADRRELGNDEVWASHGLFKSWMHNEPIDQEPNNEGEVVWQYWCDADCVWVNCHWRWNRQLTWRKRAGFETVEVLGQEAGNETKEYIVNLIDFILSHKNPCGDVKMWHMRMVEEAGLLWGLSALTGDLIKPEATRSKGFRGGEYVWQWDSSLQPRWPKFQTMQAHMQTLLDEVVRKDPNLAEAKINCRKNGRQGSSMPYEMVFNFKTMEVYDPQTDTVRLFRKMSFRIVHQRFSPVFESA